MDFCSGSLNGFGCSKNIWLEKNKIRPSLSDGGSLVDGKLKTKNNKNLSFCNRGRGTPKPKAIHWALLLR